MKIRGSLTITKDLTLLNPGGLAPAEGLYAISDSSGKVLWGNLSLPQLKTNAVYAKKGTLGVYDNKLYFSLVSNASGNDFQNTGIWCEITSTELDLTADQLGAINGANNPTSANPFLTKEDLKNFTIAGTAPVNTILSTQGLLNTVWLSSTSGVDSYGTAVVAGDGLISTGINYKWKNIGQLRGPAGVEGPIGLTGTGVIIKGTTELDNILLRNPLPIGQMWISSDSGTDDLGSPVKPGDGIVSNGINWYNIGPFRGPAAEPTYTGTYVIKGSVTWLYNYTYLVRADIYVIDGRLYNAKPVIVTLTTAHTSADRIDVFVADINGSVFVEEGLPGNPAATPGINTSIMVPIASAEVIKNTAVSPISISHIIYNENSGLVGGEWDASVLSSNGATISLTSTDNPASGVLCIKAQNAKNEVLEFTNNDTVLFGTGFSGVAMKMKSLDIENTCNITVRLLSGGKQISDAVDISGFGFDYTNVEGWQMVTISIVNFRPIAEGFDAMHIVFEDPTSVGVSNVLIDDITYQYGVKYEANPRLLEYTSQLHNNGDGASPFVTEADLPGALNLNLQAVTTFGGTTDKNITTQTQRSSGKRVSNTAKVELGDYDDLGGKTKVVIDDALKTILLMGEARFKDSVSELTTTVKTTYLTGNTTLHVPNRSGTIAIDGDYVDLVSAQLIKGIKTFSATPNFSNGAKFVADDKSVTLSPGVFDNQIITLPEISGTLALKSEMGTFVFSQPEPEGTWVIVHNKNKYPSVTVTNLARESVESTVAYPDMNTVVVTVFPVIAGFAFIN